MRIVLLLIMLTVTSATIGQKKTAALTECTMLDLTMQYKENKTPALGVFAFLTKQQRKHLLDTILDQLSQRYSLDNIAVLPKDSIAFANSSMKGIGKLRSNDRQLTAGKSYDFYIKIYTEYQLSAATILGAAVKNTSQASFSMYIAIFDSSGKRIWFPDAKVKEGIGLGSQGDVDHYYNSNNQKAEAYLFLFEKALKKIFE